MQLFTKEKPQTKVNFRPIVFAAISAIVGAAIAVPVSTLSKWYVWVPIWVIFAAVAIFLSRFRQRAVLCAVLCFLVGLCTYFGGVLCIRSFSADKVAPGEYTVTGTVLKRVDTRLILGDIRIYDEYGKIGGGRKMTVYVEEEKAIDVGDIVRFFTQVENADGDYQMQENLRYVALAETVAVIGKTANPFLRLNSRLVTALKEGLGERIGGIAAALLVGASYEADDGDMEAFRRGGVAHIFAVSGLHVAFLAGAILKLLQLLCVGNRISALVTVPVLFLYSALCAFTPSSLRAAVMCSVGLLARVTGRQYDGLNSLSLSVVLLLWINPFYVANVGFQLSVTAVLSLTLYARRFSCVLFDGVRRIFRLSGNEFTRPRLFALTSTVSTLLVVQLWSFPIVVRAFGYVAAYGVFFNALLVPLVGIAFPLLIVTAFLSLIGGGSVFLFPAGFLLRCSLGLVLLPRGGALPVSLSTVFVVAYYLLLTVLSGRIALRKEERTSFTVGLALFLTVCAVMMAFSH